MWTILFHCPVWCSFWLLICIYTSCILLWYKYKSETAAKPKWTRSKYPTIRLWPELPQTARPQILNTDRSLILHRFTSHFIVPFLAIQSLKRNKNTHTPFSLVIMMKYHLISADKGVRSGPLGNYWHTDLRHPVIPSWHDQTEPRLDLPAPQPVLVPARLIQTRYALASPAQNQNLPWCTMGPLGRSTLL